MCANSKDLANRTVSDNISKDRAYEIALNPKYDEYQRRLASMVHKFFDRKIGSVTKANVNKVLAQELHKPVIAVWPADLADFMYSKHNEGRSVVAESAKI